MQRFWIPDAFVRKLARDLNTSDHSVFMALSSHANRNGETFVGYRKIAEEMGLNKDTVVKSIKRLKAYGLVVRLDKKINGQVSFLKLITVLFEQGQPSEPVVHKEVIKENFKETVSNNFKSKEGSGFVDGIDWEKRRRILAEMRENVAKLGKNKIKKEEVDEQKCNKCNTIKKEEQEGYDH
ncbi:MAG: helix-turn-helix domain-containing protein [bacterium]